MKNSAIIGHCGQDGSLLSENLKKFGHHVHGIKHGDLDLLDIKAVRGFVEKLNPDEIYFLAAFHHSSQDNIQISDRELFQRSHDVHVTGALNFLEAIRLHKQKTRFFYAGSSHVFGEPSHTPQTERTPFAPCNIYGITKATGIEMCRHYRRAHGVHASVGLLYNHESPLRRPGFVSKKIVQGAVDIAKGSREQLEIGDLSARVDWGYAPDYVDAMRRILSLEKPDDFVVATGESHSVQDFVECAFQILDIDWKKHVRINSQLLPRSEYPMLVGNAAFLKSTTGWNTSVSFEEMVKILVEAEFHGR